MLRYINGKFTIMKLTSSLLSWSFVLYWSKLRSRIEADLCVYWSKLRSRIEADLDVYWSKLRSRIEADLDVYWSKLRLRIEADLDVYWSKLRSRIEADLDVSLVSFNINIVEIQAKSCFEVNNRYGQQGEYPIYYT